MKPRRTVGPRPPRPDHREPIEADAWRHLIAAIEVYASAVAALEQLTLARQGDLTELEPDPETGIAPAHFARARLAIAEATCARARAACERSLRALDVAWRTTAARHRPTG